MNRLIRVSYGPFQLGELTPGGVEEVRPKVLREQLGTGAQPPAGAEAAGQPKACKIGPCTRAMPGVPLKPERT